jgi:hypothetical protein
MTGVASRHIVAVSHGAVAARRTSMTQQAAESQQDRFAAFGAKVVAFGETLSAEEQAWLVGLLCAAAAHPDEVQGYLFSAINHAPGGVGGPTAVGPVHGSGVQLNQQVDGSQTPLTWQQQVLNAIANAGGIAGLLPPFA